MKRRAFTATLGYGWASLHLGLLAACGGDDPAPDPAPAGGHTAVREALVELAGALQGIDYVGPECDRMLGLEQPLERLLERLPQDAPSLHEGLRELFRGEYERNEVMDIDGWSLSHSECLLLAAAARAQGLTVARETASLAYRDQPFIGIERWGPDRTLVGEIFNPVGAGRGGFWLRVQGPVNGSMRLVLGGVELATHFEPGVITASLEPDYMEQVIARPGAYELVLTDKSRMLRQPVGVLTVLERPPRALLDDGTPSAVFCQVKAWGPDTALYGEAFNPQPDGSAGFWVQIGCAPRTAVLRLDGVDLPTTVQPGLVTAPVAHFAGLARGGHLLEIHDPASGERLVIGTLEVR